MQTHARTRVQVVLGATGFTGRLVCEHLARDYTGRVRWAMAGRSAARLEGAKRELARTLDSDDAIKVRPCLAFQALVSLPQTIYLLQGANREPARTLDSDGAALGVRG